MELIAKAYAKKDLTIGILRRRKDLLLKKALITTFKESRPYFLSAGNGKRIKAVLSPYNIHPSPRQTLLNSQAACTAQRRSPALKFLRRLQYIFLQIS